MQERRRDPRYPVHWPLRAGHRRSGCLYGHVVNISGVSLLFVTPGEYDVDELVEVEIAVNPLFMIRSAVRIVRTEQIGTTEWVYGAEFHNLSEQEGSLLSQTLVAIQAGETDDALSFRPKTPLSST